MEIQFTPESTLKELQDSFSKLYPNLKLGFFVDLNNDGTYTADELIKNLHLKLDFFNPKIEKGSLSVAPNTKIVDFETEAFQLWGVDVQVFRSSAKLWLATKQTDHKSFFEQQEMSIHMNHTIEPSTPLDYQDMD
jgi:hypothetical protein